MRVKKKKSKTWEIGTKDNGLVLVLTFDQGEEECGKDYWLAFGYRWCCSRYPAGEKKSIRN